MDVRAGFAQALQSARKAKGLTQEDFSNVSSRTYVSTLERGIKSPTLEKVGHLASVLGLHPLTLLVLAYSKTEGADIPTLLATVVGETKNLLSDE